MIVVGFPVFRCRRHRPMGNESSRPANKLRAVNAFRGRSRPRVVLESPAGSTTDNTRVTKVTFANSKRDGVETFRARPQMADIGIIHPDLNTGGRIRFKKRQTADFTSDLAASMASVRSSGSMPADGNWEPTLDPHSNEDGYIQSRYRIDDLALRDVRDFRNYSGFSSRHSQKSYKPEIGLTRVEEI